MQPVAGPSLDDVNGIISRAPGGCPFAQRRRKLTRMDLDEILSVTFSGVRPEEEQAVMALLADCDLHAGDMSSEKLRHFLVARKGDAVIGTVGLEIFPPQALLRSLAVAEDFRGQGIARRLIGAIERYA